jgi:TetR/AcrR family transcriptional repressor of bet genes
MPRLVDHDQRREQIATLAEQVICEKGLAALTIRDVAAAGGWSTTAVTHYFRSRDALLLYTLRHSRRKAADRIEAAVTAGADPVRAIVEQVLPLDAERRTQWCVWLAFWGSAVGSDVLGQVQHDAQANLRRSVEEALRLRGTVDRIGGAVVQESERLVALLDGISVQAVFAPEDWPPERQLAHFPLN